MFEYRKVKPGVARIVRQMIKDGIYRHAPTPEGAAEVEAEFKRAALRILELYGLIVPLSSDATGPGPSIRFDFIEAEAPHIRGNGFFRTPDLIRMWGQAPSVVTFLHELRHMMGFLRGRRWSEAGVQRWSLAVFERAVPRMAARAIAEGRVLIPRRPRHA